jgi:hypothetical protein
MSNLNNLIQAIARSELAYQHYLKDQKYFQAIRIYNANKLVYNTLESLLFVDICLDKEKIIDFIFHLDDWFSQFNESVELRSFSLNDVFVFERVEGMFPFPKDFISEIKIQL